MSNLIRHIACESCGSSDGNAIYDDGHGYCFVCSKFTPPTDGRETKDATSKAQRSLVAGIFQDLPKRKIKEGTCRLFGYMVNKEQRCHIANFRTVRQGPPVAQKLRDEDKNFTITGEASKMGLFGQHLWQPGKTIIITEGEIDALSYAQAFDCKYPVVSLPNGAQSAAKAIKTAYDFLCGFEAIYLAFDMDKAGRAAVEAVAPILPPGRVKVIELPRKDANDVLVQDGPGPLVKAFWSAQTWRPDGIISGNEITLEGLRTATARGYELPYPQMDARLHGLRKRELMLLTAGSGIGKSTFAREIAYHLHQAHGLTIGNVYLEESKEKTAQGYIAIHNNVSLGNLRANPDILSDEAWATSLAAVVHDRMFFYDHFGSLDADRLLQKMRYMVSVLGTDFIILDHISIVVSGQEASSEGERRDIDILMTKLRMLVEETGVGIIAIVHLKQPEGKPHEEGGRVTLSQLRGSGSLKQLSDSVVALERNQQDEDSAHEATIRVLKNREHGDIGVCDTLIYDPDTGRLLPSTQVITDL